MAFIALLLAPHDLPQSAQVPASAAAPVACAYPGDPANVGGVSRAALAEACRSLIESDSSNADAYLVLMYALHPDSAATIELSEAALQAFPDNALIQFWGGLALHRAGRAVEAMAALERSAALESSRADPLIEAGIIAIGMGQLERAVSLLLQATEREPDEPRAWGYLARAEAALARHADAVRHWDRAQKESGWKYLFRSGDQEAYDSSLAIAPDAHVPPSQLAPTLRALAMLALPLLLAGVAAASVLRLGRSRLEAPRLRLFGAVALAHFIISVTLLIATIGAAYGAHQGWPSHWIDAPLIAIGQLLVFPIVIARAVLPFAWGVGYSWPWVMVNSLLWAGAVTILVHLLRQRRSLRSDAGQHASGSP